MEWTQSTTESKTTDRRLSSISLIGQGTYCGNTDQFLQLELTAGNADLSHQTADEALDQISADIADDYYKATLDYQVNYPFTPQQNLYLYAKGQWANKNLDSSEKISMGDYLLFVPIHTERRWVI